MLVSTENGSAEIPTRWRDTYHYAWGAQYRPGQRWAFTAGAAYDTNPVDAQYRNAQLPVDRQLRYALRESLSVGGYINYADLGRARISGQRFGGEYRDNSALQLLVNANWTF